MIKSKTVLLIISLTLFTSPALADTYQFNTCGQEGTTGPSSGCYSGDNSVNIIGNGIQQWEVPESGTYEITAAGAEPYENSHSGDPGRGAVIQGEVDLDEGDVLNIIVGQRGNTPQNNVGAGGGTFVSKVDGSGDNTDWNANVYPLIIAGGGGSPGAGYGRACNSGDAKDGHTATYGTDSMCCDGPGGEDGDGGESCRDSQRAGAGGGWFTSGEGDADGGEAFLNDPVGGEGNRDGYGGYGGGGGPYDAGGSNSDGGGAGGGYSGGGSGSNSGSSSNEDGGGGGGSFIHGDAESPATSDGNWDTTGLEPHNVYTGFVDDLSEWNTGNGYVEIEQLLTPASIDDFQFTDYEDQGEFELSLDANKDINQCIMEIDGNSYSTDVTGNECHIAERVDPNDYNWELGEEVEVYMEIQDTEQCGSACWDDVETTHSFPNDSPELELEYPDSGEEFEAASDKEIPLQVSVEDSQAEAQNRELELTYFNITSGSEEIDSDTIFNGEGNSETLYTDDATELHEGTHEWSATVSDGDLSTTEASLFEIEYVFPDILNPNPNDETIIHTETTLTVDVEQEGGLNLVEASLQSEDGEATDMYPGGSDSTSLQAEWDNLDEGETHEWTVTAENENELEVTETFSFDVIAGESFRMESDLDHDYSAVIKFEEDSAFFNVELVNPDNEKDIHLSMEDSDVDAVFPETEDSEKTVTVGTDDRETVTVQVNEDEIGSHILEIEIEDLDLGVTETREKPVEVLESEIVDSSTEVPGMNLISVLFVLLSILVIFHRLQN